MPGEGRSFRCSADLYQHNLRGTGSCSRVGTLRSRTSAGDLGIVREHRLGELGGIQGISTADLQWRLQFYHHRLIKEDLARSRAQPDDLLLLQLDFLYPLLALYRNEALQNGVDVYSRVLSLVFHPLTWGNN